MRTILLAFIFSFLGAFTYSVLMSKIIRETRRNYEVCVINGMSSFCYEARIQVDSILSFSEKKAVVYRDGKSLVVTGLVLTYRKNN